MSKKLCLNGCFQVLPVTDFGKHPRSPDGLASRCKRCEADRLMRAKHGMTSADKAALAALQGGCAICGQTNPGRKGWVIDHDRTCCPGDRSCVNCRRGVLCQWCNSALGYAHDDPATLRRMADYIESGTRLPEFNSGSKSEVQVDMASQHGNTDGRTGRTYEDPTCVTARLSSATCAGGAEK